MTNVFPRAKKPKLEHEVQVVSPSGVCAAVTCMTAVTPAVIFSGHRDGTIRRWVNEDNSEALWTISACADLTQHEIYGREELLGIAGLAVRRQGETSPTDPVLHSHVLYSWNHQREDMRESNGIPQKIMIWKCSTGERCSALMVDVGRSAEGSFANPLVSCMVFSRLLVEPPPKQPQHKQQQQQQEEEDANKNVDVAKVWVDAVLVGLLATCEPLPQPGATATAAAQCDEAPKPPKAKNPAVVTGNLLPFNEHTRKRMPPWIVSGGFVRALATVPDKYIVSVTETTRTTIATSTTKETAQNDTDDDKNVSNGGGIASKKDGTATVSKEEADGEALEVSLWDVTEPGTVLHRLKLYDIAANIWTTGLRGSVYYLALSGSQLLMAFTASGDCKNGDSRVAVIDLPQSTNNKEKKEGTHLKVHGSYQTTGLGPVSAGDRDFIALAGKAADDDKPDTKQNVVHLYSITDLCKACDENATNASCDIRLLERASVVLPLQSASGGEVLSARFGPSSLSLLNGSSLVAGYRNGTILSAKTMIELPDSSCAIATDGANEFASCSTASLGLRGQLCPHLSAEANNLQLRNQCTIQ
jgi:hypothetical protein